MTTRRDRRGRPTRAELLARVEALIADARAHGWVEVSEEAAPYVAPADPRVVEHVPLGPGWARYTLRLADGTVVLEGGARRVWMVPQERGASMVAAAARGAVECATTLHHLLALLLRATRGGAGRTPVERAIEELGLVATLEDRIRQRAPIETQRLAEPELLALLSTLATDDDLKRLAGDRSLPAEVQARLAVPVRPPDPAAALEQEIEALLAAGAVELDASVVGAVARDPAAISGGGRWWAFGVRSGDGGIHLEGGARRLRVVARAEAERLIEARIAEVLAGDDLRVLLHLRACVRDSRPSALLYEAVAARPSALVALDARICALAPGATADPPLGAGAGEMLREAGVDEVTIRRLRRLRELPPEQRLDRAPPEPSPSARLDALIQERASWVELREDAPPLRPDDPAITEVIRSGSPWAALVAVLRDGSLHMEGGVTRVRLCPPAVARALVDARVAALLEEDDLHRLLHTATLAAGAPRSGTALARLARGPGREQLLARLRVLAEAAPPGVRLARRSDVEILRQAGVGGAILAGLTGDPSLDEARVPVAPPRPARSRLDELLAAATTDGWVEVHEDIVPFVRPDDPAVRELVPVAGAPGLLHAAVLADGSLHLEGGRTRVRLCPPRRVEALLRERWARVLGETDLHVLLDLAIRARETTQQPTLHGWVAARADRRAALLSRIKERASDTGYAGRITRRPQLDVLAEAGVDEAILAALGSKLLLPGVAALAAARKGTSVRPPPGDRLAELIADRASKGWVEVHEDVAPFLDAEDPAILERIPARAVPWARLIAVLEDGALHLEGGRQRVRLCSPRAAERLVDAAARRALESDDLIALLDLAVRARRHPPNHTVWAHLVAVPALWDGLLLRIRELAREPKWEGRVPRRSWQDILALAGVDALRRLFLEGTVHQAGIDDGARSAAARRAAEAAEARLVGVLSERIAGGWVTLPTGAVPYVDADDPRIRELFPDPDPDHRFAAILMDGTVIHEGGTTRFWLVPPERAGEVLERHAWETARAGEVHALLDLLLSSGQQAARHPLTALIASRPDLRCSIEDRIRTAARAGRHRFTRPEHLDLLRALGVAPRRAIP